jgi:hypothetical protein
MTLTRQIHLDFHCSEHIKNIAKSFDKSTFQKALLEANVTSINLFAKCHHSWSYYPTEIGQTHPHLNFDLLGSQIEACKEIGIRTFVYYAVGWSANDAENHPEWCARNKEGSLIIHGDCSDSKHNLKAEPLPHFHWKFMCVNNAYHDLIYSQIEELCERYAVDGFWFDIYQVHRLCYCKNCKESMITSGVDLDDLTSVEAFNASLMKRHCKTLNTLIRNKLPQAEVFFNGTTALDTGANFRHRMYEHNTIQDLEDLPTTWGGYDKLAMQSKFFLNAGFPITAMSGKFHTDWGEFGGFKHPNALKYEAASMIASGANCNFGDQLHPNGILDSSTYENIAYAYDYIKQVEAYGIGGSPISKLGIWRSFDQECDEGLSKMLLEAHMDFDVANFSEDLCQYEILIFPSKTKLSVEETLKVKQFIQSGGSIITLAKSLLNFTENCISQDFGIKYMKDSSCDSDYTLIRDPLYPIFVKTPFLNYKAAIQVRPINEVEVLADIFEPYFNRTSEHYCSHQKTPFKEIKAEHPAIVKRKSSIFIAHELDSMYHKYGARIHRDLFIKCLNLLYKAPMIEVNLPSAARINLLHQENEKRFVLHLLYSTPIRRGIASVIEDSVPLSDIEVSFDFPHKIQSVALIPDQKDLPISKDRTKQFVTIPKFETHCALVFHYL